MPHSPMLRDIVTVIGDVFIYWDNSNIFISAKETAVDREGGDARSRVRIHFRNFQLWNESCGQFAAPRSWRSHTSDSSD